VDYRHGFIEGLEGPSAALVIAIAALASREPVAALRVTDEPDEPDAWLALLETPAFATIRELRIIGAHAPPALLRHPNARALDAIEFRWEIHPDAFDDTPDPLVAELPTLSPLPNLRSFGVITDHYFIPGLVAAIAAAPFLATVETLALGAAHEPADVRALLESPHLARVRALDLPCLHDEGVRALAAHPGAARLERLRLTSNWVTDEGARALATSPVLRDDLELTIPKRRHRSIDRFRLTQP